jgi:hypothetical protein
MLEAEATPLSGMTALHVATYLKRHVFHRCLRISVKCSGGPDICWEVSTLVACTKDPDTVRSTLQKHFIHTDLIYSGALCSLKGLK